MGRPLLPLIRTAAMAAVLLSPPLSAQARDITDMAGRTVTIPDTIRNVHVMSHSLAILTALAPEMSLGLPFPFRRNPEAAPYLPPRYAQLPQLDNNVERLKALAPDIALGWTTPSFVRERVPQLDSIGLPTVLVEVDRLDDYPRTFRFLGGVLGREKRAETLARALETMMAATAADVATIAPDKRLRVYYAEGIDGLTTQCDSSDRSDVIRRAGAVNAMHCTNPATNADNMPIDLETLLSVDPDAIVTRFADTAGNIAADPRWSQLRAVRQGRVYAVPSLPFNWFDRPPSFMRALGTEWLLQKLYPEHARRDLAAETRDFYRLFFDVSLTEADLDKILMRP